MEELVEVDIQSRVKKDIEYINNEIIAKQIDGNLCKWSRPLNAISVTSLPPKQFFDYWEKQYKNYPEYLNEILSVCLDKLSNGLISRDKMIDLIKNSNDFDSEKEKAIRLLGGIYVK